MQQQPPIYEVAATPNIRYAVLNYYYTLTAHKLQLMLALPKAETSTSQPFSLMDMIWLTHQHLFIAHISTLMAHLPF